MITINTVRHSDQAYRVDREKERDQQTRDNGLDRKAERLSVGFRISI